MNDDSVKPSRLRAMLRWLTPNGGTILLVLALVLTQNVWAKSLQSALNAPGPSATTINYQGRLADSGGNPVADGSYGMSFALYDAETGGSALWTESHAAVPVSNGLFSVGLGSQTSGGIPTTMWDGDRYLEITVSGETLEPRELIRSVPVAGMALTVPDGAIGMEQIADGSINQDKAPFAVQHYRGTTLMQNAKVSTGTYIAGLSGGSIDEYVSIDITDLEFGGTPTGIAQAVNLAEVGPQHLITANYNWDGSSATSASIRVSRVDGQPLGSGSIRFDLILWSP